MAIDGCLQGAEWKEIYQAPRKIEQKVWSRLASEMQDERDIVKQSIKYAVHFLEDGGELSRHAKT